MFKDEAVLFFMCLSNLNLSQFRQYVAGFFCGPVSLWPLASLSSWDSGGTSTKGIPGDGARGRNREMGGL